jgi:two-component system, cell cycle response regulator DivK
MISPIRTVLLVEDNDQNRYLMTFLLERGGFSVTCAIDGQAAIALAAGMTPSAILLDIQLPGMDGYAVAAALRRFAHLADVPIVAVTSYAMPGDRDKAMGAGCDAYIEKPIDPDTFVMQVESQIAARQGTVAS